MSRGRFTSAQARFVETRRVGRLATASVEGQLHVVPICYAFDGIRLYSSIDEKPKRVEASHLRRIRNVQQNQRVSLVIDDYSDDWSKLAFVIVQGRASIVDQGGGAGEALALLREKYPQYRSMALEERPLIVIEADSVVSWGRVM